MDLYSTYRQRSAPSFFSIKCCTSWCTYHKGHLIVIQLVFLNLWPILFLFHHCLSYHSTVALLVFSDCRIGLVLVFSLVDSLQMMYIINLAVGWHYFLLGHGYLPSFRGSPHLADVSFMVLPGPWKSSNLNVAESVPWKYLKSLGNV